MTRVPDEYIVSLQGKKFILFPGLLELAHQDGLSYTHTDILQFPTQENGNTTIVRAIVRTGKGEFSGIGDASPASVPNKSIAVHSIRMAECVPLTAKILTKSGWKTHDKLSIGELVLAYDTQSDTCKWTPLEAVSVFNESYETLNLKGRSFSATVTPNHTWAVRNISKGIILKKTCDLNTSDRIIVSAVAESGKSNITPKEAAILGWLFTDGCLRIKFDDAGNIKNIRAQIDQSKQHYVSEIRELVGAFGCETVSQPYERKMPSGQISMCKSSHRFSLRADFIRSLLKRANVTSTNELSRLVLDLSQEARKSMLEAMLHADGSVKSGHRWTFSKSKRDVVEAVELLATLEGYALGSPTQRNLSYGKRTMYSRAIRVNRVVRVNYLNVSPGEHMSVWCPTTQYGTWVMNHDGFVSITGNTRAVARALRVATNVSMTAFEELGGDVEDKPQQRQPQAQAQAKQTNLKVLPEPSKSSDSVVPMTDEQGKRVQFICKQIGMDSATLQTTITAKYGHGWKHLTKQEANELIDQLSEFLEDAV